MIKKLRLKFIVISLVSVFVILFGIIGTMNIVNYVSVNEEGNHIISVLKSNGGTFPSLNRNDDPNNNSEENSSTSLVSSDSSENTSSGNSSDFKPSEKDPTISGEIPYQTRYFTVTIDLTTEQVSATNVSNIYLINEATAKQIAMTLYQSDLTSGYYKKKYLYDTLSLDDEASLMYIFVDRSNELERFQTFLETSLLISSGGLVLFAIVIIFLSSIVLKPAIESEKKQKTFITDASHSLKTPLAIIQADNEVLSMENGESRWNRSIQTQIDSMTKLVSQLVYLTRLDEGSFKQDRRDINISKMLEDTLDSFSSVYEMKGFTVTSDIDKDIIFNCDEKSISELFNIFLENASKYTSENGFIQVTLKHRGNKGIHLLFANSIDYDYEGDPNRLFDRFYRADSSRNSSKGGTGLGLSIAKSIVTTYKGRVKAEIESKKQIRFEIWF